MIRGLKGDKDRDKEKNKKLSLDDAAQEIRDRVAKSAPKLKGKSNVRAGAIMKEIHEKESQWLKRNIDPEVAKKKVPKLLLIPRENARHWWIEIKINPVYYIPKNEKGTAGEGQDYTGRSVDYVGNTFIWAKRRSSLFRP